MWPLSRSLRNLSRKSLWLFAFKLIHPEGLYTNKEALCAAPARKQVSSSEDLNLSCWSPVKVAIVYSSAASAGKSPLKVVFGGSENALDIVAVHPKWNTTSIKQTRWTRPIHQRAAWISYWVQLRRDKCRTSSVCPRLPIDRDHHCDVAFYLASCSLKLYIILFPTRRSHRRTGRGWERARLWLYLLFSVCIAIICSNCFHGVRWSHLCPAAAKFFFFSRRVCWWFPAPATAVSGVLGLFLGRCVSFWLTCCCSLTYWPLSTCEARPLPATPLSSTYSNVSNPAERKASWLAIDWCHYGIPRQ